jgi:hypothetical protein
LAGPRPAIASSFSATYHGDYEPYFIDDVDVTQVVSPHPYNMYLKPKTDHLMSYYLGNVMDLQYLLADSQHIRHILLPIVTTGVSGDAARLLAAIHVQRSDRKSDNFVALQDEHTKDQYDALMQVLNKTTRYTEDEALAAISVISSFLFDGGGGAWQGWLKVSYSYAESIFRDRDPRDTLQHCPDTTRFIIKAAIWFDVLAAITTQESPRFLHYIRQLYSPETSLVWDPSLPPSPELSMMSVMGCENHIVWVMAEASALSVWKREQIQRGCLSVPELVARANNLDKTYLNPTPLELPFDPNDKDMARGLSSNIFRAATRVYLRSIVSGDFPHVPDIMEAIDETMSFVLAPHGSQRVHSCVVRSTVFAFFICGALTDKSHYRDEIHNKLSLKFEDASTSTVGNSASIRKLLNKIWSGRSKMPPRAPVPWRDVLRESSMLLV